MGRVSTQNKPSPAEVRGCGSLCKVSKGFVRFYFFNFIALKAPGSPLLPNRPTCCACGPNALDAFGHSKRDFELRGNAAPDWWLLTWCPWLGAPQSHFEHTSPGSPCKQLTLGGWCHVLRLPLQPSSSYKGPCALAFKVSGFPGLPMQRCITAGT